MSALPPLRLTIEGLALARGERRLVDDLTLVVGPGEYVELTGDNGSGKTTLVRALAGFTRPAGGEIGLSGNLGPLDEDARAAATHVLGHRDGLKGTLDARAHLAFWAGLLGAEGADVEAALTRVGLNAVADLPARGLSAGQGRRLALARLIAVPRPLWLLDEPAASLDRAGKALLCDIVEAHRGAGGIVVAAVHEPLGPAPSHAVRLGGAA